jgi:hypothetical protein
VLSVGGALLTMDSPAHAADYTPEQLQLDTLNELIAKGYTDQPKTAFKRSHEEAASVEIETGRLSQAEFNDALRIMGGMGGTSPGDRQQFVQELREERRRLTDSSD